MNTIRCIILLIFFAQIYHIEAQRIVLTEKEAIQSALQYNPLMKVSGLKIEKQEKLKSASYAIRNTELLMQAPVENEFRLGVLQTFDFPTLYSQQKGLQKYNVKMAVAEKDVTANGLVYNVRINYNDLNFLIQKYNTLKVQDSVFNDILEINEIRYSVGAISNLEKINGQAYYKQIQFKLLETITELQNSKIQLAILMGKPQDTSLYVDGTLKKIDNSRLNLNADSSFANNPITTYYYQGIKVNEKQLKVEKNRALPGITLGYLDQTNPNNDFLYRVQFGISLPLWYWTYNSKIGAAKKDLEIIKTQSQNANYNLRGEYSKALAQFRNYSNAVDYFENVGNTLASEILKSARESYRLGSIGYYIYLQNINQSFQIKLDYLQALKNYNESVITLQYLTGIQEY
ncbi:MAG: TolC family protein [Cytophagales bacterium]|nr:TolC family protein [Cytophagales bacterium]